MRDIKFRAWLDYGNGNGEMLPNIQNHINGDWAFGHIANGNVDNVSAPMQYTGLKDKNGVEIYEGDILTGGVSGHVKPVVVEWSTVRRGSTVNGATTHSGFNISEYYITFSQCRVIGNVHQNPELLGN